MKRKIIKTIIIVSFVVMTFSYIQNIQANTDTKYFNEVNKCDSYKVNNICPNFTKELYVQSGVHSCAPKKSKFCELLTGSDAVDYIHFGGSSSTFAFCREPIKSEYGSYDNNGNYNPSSPNNLPQKIIDAINIINKDKNEVMNNIHIDEDQTIKYKHRIKIPVVENIDYLNPRDNKAVITTFEMGFTMQRGIGGNDTLARYCNERNDLFNGGFKSNLYCYDLDYLNNQRPCTITLYDYTLNDDNPPVYSNWNNKCITGVIKNKLNAWNPYLARIRDRLHLRKISLSAIKEATDPNLCKYTTIDVMNSRSNKGCIEYLKLNYINNTISYTDKFKYNECFKCIYGDEPSLININNSNLSFADRSPPDNNINFNNEPFLIPRPGYIYSDITGCINTSDTSTVVNTIVRLALGIMGGIVTLRIIQGVLTMQQGDPESNEEGREIITSALIGLTVLILSAAILNFLGINILQIKDFPKFGG